MIFSGIISAKVFSNFCGEDQNILDYSQISWDFATNIVIFSAQIVELLVKTVSEKLFLKSWKRVRKSNKRPNLELEYKQVAGEAPAGLEDFVNAEVASAAELFQASAGGAPKYRVFLSPAALGKLQELKKEAQQYKVRG